MVLAVPLQETRGAPRGRCRSFEFRPLFRQIDKSTKRNAACHGETARTIDDLPARDATVRLDVCPPDIEKCHVLLPVWEKIAANGYGGLAANGQECLNLDVEFEGPSFTRVPLGPCKVRRKNI